MSQDLHFYKLKFFSEDYAAKVGREKVNQLLEEYLEKKDLEGDDELKEKLYEEIEVSIDVSASHEKIEKKLPKKFLSNARCFLMTPEVMSAIEEIVKEEVEKKLEPKAKEGKKSKSSDKQNSSWDYWKDCEELKDYWKLKELFDKNLLIVNIF
jgi:NDP-sugar pyrophosphorylase family protein